MCFLKWRRRRQGLLKGVDCSGSRREGGCKPSFWAVSEQENPTVTLESGASPIRLSPVPQIAYAPSLSPFAARGVVPHERGRGGGLAVISGNLVGPVGEWG